MLAALTLCLQVVPASADLIEGTANADDLDGTAEDDIIKAYGGPDTVHAKDGADEIHLGAGGDVSYGQGGNDDTYGGDSGQSWSYSDRMWGASGNDYFRDVEGSDQEWVCGEGDDDTVDFPDGDGNDWGAGGQGTDTRAKDAGDYWDEGPVNPCPP